MASSSSPVASYRWKIAAIICAGAFVGSMDLTMVNISLPRLSTAFAVETRSVLWVQVAYLLVSTGLMLTLGRLGNLLGRKRMYVLGLLVLALGLGLASLASSLGTLILFRLVQAVGHAMEVSVGTAIMTAVFPPGQRGKAIGLLSSVVAAGLGVGPVIGGGLVDALDWPAVFYIRLPLVLGVAVLAWRYLRGEHTAHQRTAPAFDVAGAATLFLGLGGVLLWVNQAPRLGWTSAPVLLLGTASAVFVGSFLAIERRAASPVLDLGLFRHRLFAAATASSILYFVAVPFFSLLAPFYLIQGAGFSASRAGLWFAVFPASRVLLAMPSGWLSDRIGSRLLCSTGMALVAVCLFGLGRLGAVPSALGLLALGSAAFGSPNTSAIMGSVPRDRLGTASGMVATGRQMGQALGMAIAGSVFAYRQAFWERQLATSDGTREALAIVHGFADTVTVAALVALAGAATSLVRGGHSAEDRP
ncbi:MAG: MFS transporter [Chloroflexi bacterium]|nr:MFS transporter [Chloroflexota bacterium]